MQGGAAGPIVVASAVDAAYPPLAEVVATSIAASASSGRPVHYHVLYDGPDSAATRRLDTCSGCGHNTEHHHGCRHQGRPLAAQDPTGQQ